MPVFGERYKRAYPGLVPFEAALWRAFLDEHETEFDEFRYNVHVGEGVAPLRGPGTGDAELDANILLQWKQATQKKIDVVALRGSEWWIFEVEDRANMRALGQLVAYESLLPKSIQGVGPTQLACVCERIGADMGEIFEEQDIQVFVVKPRP